MPTDPSAPPLPTLESIRVIIKELREEADDCYRHRHIPCQHENSWHATDFRQWADRLEAAIGALRVREEEGHGEQPHGAALLPVDPSAAVTTETLPTDERRGYVDGVLYCYGGCGTRYSDFPCDTLLPTPLWNRIAIGPPFDHTQVGIEREGRGGVLCPTCIIQRLVALPECTAVFADIEDPRQLSSDEIASLRQGIEDIKHGRFKSLDQIDAEIEANGGH